VGNVACMSEIRMQTRYWLQSLMETDFMETDVYSGGYVYTCRGAQILHKSRSHLEILGA